MNRFDEYEREQAILSALETEGRVLVNDLVAHFSVSAVTVRKDLDRLERRSLLRRIRGGAVTSGSSDEGAWSMRVRHATEAKQDIAQATAPLVQDGDAIAMDSSTSAFYLAHHLLNRRNLTVVTNGLRTAQLFMEASDAMVVMPGGILRRPAESMVGPIGDLLTGRGRISKGFFGLVGLSTELGLLEVSLEEAHMKAMLASACDEVHGLFDASKAGRFGLHSFVALDRITTLRTDRAIAADTVAAWNAVGVEVHVAPHAEQPSVSAITTTSGGAGKGTA